MEAEAGSPSHAVIYAAKTNTGQEIILSGADFAISFYLCLRWICQDHVARPHKNCIFTNVRQSSGGAGLQPSAF